jgi:hypothetical protein
VILLPPTKTLIANAAELVAGVEANVKDDPPLLVDRTMADVLADETVKSLESPVVATPPDDTLMVQLMGLPARCGEDGLQERVELVLGTPKIKIDSGLPAMDWLPTLTVMAKAVVFASGVA